MKIQEFDIKQCPDTRMITLHALKTIEVSTDSVNTSEQMYSLFLELENPRVLADEFLYLFCFNTKMIPLGYFIVARGTCNACYTNGRAIFMRALRVGAASIIVLHNHPSGDVLPSKDDKELASTLQQIADLLGVALADFCIVGDSFYSFRKNELL